MEDKASSHKRDKLIEDKFIKGSTMDKNPLIKGVNSNREGAAIFQVYDPKTDTFETKAFIKKKKKSNKE